MHSRMEKAYRRRGYPHRWIDKRIGTISTRHDVASEWHRRGARESEQFRTLTNELFHAAFGMDVQQYREYKGLPPRGPGSGGKLRDQLSDLELVLVALAETTATELSRRRGSSTFEQLLVDVMDAGRIVARARREIERQSRPIPPAKAA